MLEVRIFLLRPRILYLFSLLAALSILTTAQDKDKKDNLWRKK
jgi:hypothetical protein